MNRVVPPGTTRDRAELLAHQLAELPQRCLRNDRLSVLDQEGQPEQAAMAAELQYGADSLTEALEGAARFAAGAGRHGADASDD